MADHPECLVRRSQKVGASILVLLVALASATPVRAQNIDSVQTARAEDVLARVRKSSAGDVQAARALADSLVSGLPADATVMPEALFAKASIAASAAEAERDYARIVTEYRFSARVPDALMRLAILESARNNRVGALRHLDRLLRDHGGSPVRSRASLMAGRMRMDMNDPARACDLLAAAYASAGPNERDVIDQAQTAGATCPTSIVVMAERDPPPLGIARAPRTAAPVAVRSVSPRRAAARRDSISARTATSRLAKAPSPAVSVVRRDAVTRATSAPTVVSSAPPVAREAVTSSVVEAMPSPVAPCRAASLRRWLPRDPLQQDDTGCNSPPTTIGRAQRSLLVCFRNEESPRASKVRARRFACERGDSRRALKRKLRRCCGVAAGRR